LIFGVPIGDSFILENKGEDIEVYEIVKNSDFEIFVHGHSACERVYYIGIPIISVSLDSVVGGKLKEDI
jgi:hypothetical protein